MKKTIGIITIAAVCVCLLAACAGPPAEIVGKWSGGDTVTEIRKDGTFETTWLGEVVEKGTFALDGSSIYMYEDGYDHSAGETSRIWRAQDGKLEDESGNLLERAE